MNNYLNSLFSLQNKTALVTGGGTGIGREIALGLAQAGATVAITGRRRDVLEKTAAEIEALGGRAIPVEMDVTSEATVQKAMTKIVDAVGIVDILVNNAGAECPKTLEAATEEDWDWTLDVNLVGPWRLSKICLEQWKSTNHCGNIINIASITGTAPQKGMAPYSVSKAAMLHMTHVMALEWGKYNVRVNAIAPGYFETDITTAFLNSPGGEAMRKRIPMYRVGNLEEIVGAAIFLAADTSSYMTGSTVTVDGGHVHRTL